MNYWKPILAALVIFAAGVITGGLTLDLGRSSPNAAAWTPPPDITAPTRPGGPPRGMREGPGQGRDRHIRELCDRMERELGLKTQQRERVEQILVESHERVRAIVEEVRPKTQAEFARMEEEIKAVLTPEQAAKYEEIAQERRSFRSPERSGPPDRTGRPDRTGPSE